VFRRSGLLTGLLVGFAPLALIFENFFNLSSQKKISVLEPGCSLPFALVYHVRARRQLDAGKRFCGPRASVPADRHSYIGAFAAVRQLGRYSLTLTISEAKGGRARYVHLPGRPDAFTPLWLSLP